MQNPVVDGWYADPEARVYNDKVYIYVTKSLPYKQQKNLDLVITKDLQKYEIIHDVLDMSTFPGAEFAIWAPSVVEKEGKYYLIFSANDIHHDDEIGGLYIGVSDTPEGKFRNVYKDGRPFLNRFINGAQPIDAHFYKEGEDVYLYYGGWNHLNVCKMNDTMDGLQPLRVADVKQTILELMPEDYVEAPCMVKGNKRYILMYSSGAWSNGSYCVKTASSDSLLGPFTYESDILTKSEIADGPGHNSEFTFRNKRYTAYHRRRIGDGTSYHRELCIDEMTVQGDIIKPIVMT